ncbi:sigma-54 interaction domain-containing protein [Brevibacillus centrosporus]|uniref:sigma-54 interaction domain-containing protein n=1 Tax=Brevibacillus centrosporus TaxID=54910 RepID=UPI002E24E293|nr:sigma 54-interacting transcriptional regulator [Brevibacillus centrosporus]MED1952109.1 sigma 54-interacting transcriptional regulator [Brevibacillus centrosporus]
MIALYRLDKELERKIAALLDSSHHPIGYFYSIKSIIDQMMNPFVVITTEPYREELESYSLPVVCLSIDLNDIRKVWERLCEKEERKPAVVVCGSRKEKFWLEKEYDLEQKLSGEAKLLFQLQEEWQEDQEQTHYLSPKWSKNMLPQKPPTGEWHLVEPSIATLRRAVQQAESLITYTRDRLREKHLMEAVVNSAHDAVIAVDRHSHITLVNEHAKLLLGLNGDVLGKPITDYIPHSDMLRVLKTGRQELGDVATVLDRSIVINRIPVIVKDQIVGAVSNFKEIIDIQKMEMSLRKKLHENGLEARYRLESIIGSSPEILYTKEQAAMFARTNATVLITGESGTGKELFAQGIHLESTRAMGPFLAVNCAALPESLLESELFGYEEGSFTGAKKGGKPGLFELAHGGTLFLDEIGEMPLRIQVLLLRVLQERRVRRVGGERIIPVDVRIVAATNRDLAEEIEREHFRADLYYRINMLKLDVPPLRDRLTDIPELVKSMVQEVNEQHEQKIERIDDEVYRILQGHTWPGNVRELRNVVERSVLMARDGRITAESVGFLYARKVARPASGPGTSRSGHIDPEAAKIIAVLQQSKHNKTLAAKVLGMDRTTLWRKMKQYNIQ